MSRPKEPHFFSTDLPGFRPVKRWEEYEALFAGARDGELCGEASVLYLFSRVAVPALLHANPAARLIVCLRHPAAMALSHHAQMAVTVGEDLVDFREAWAAQDDRAAGRRVPPTCGEPAMLQYRALCSFPDQLHRLFAVAPREQVHVLVLEEFVLNPRTEWLRLPAFFGLPNDGQREFLVHNTRQPRRLRWLPTLLRRVRPQRTAPWRAAKRVANSLGLHPGRALRFALRRATVTTLRPRDRERDAELMAWLRREFAEDVAATEHVLGRRLDVWR